MIFRWLALMLAVSAAGGAVAEDVIGLRMTFDVGGSPVTVTRDALGVVQFDGLPFPGLVLYAPVTGVVYYQHPDEAGWFSVTPEDTAGYASPAVFAAGKAWQPYLDAPTRRWEVKTAQMPCDNWFASEKAASVTGLTVTDFWRVFAALQWLQAGMAAGPCDRLKVDDQFGRDVGFPLYMEAPGGRWQLTELTQASVTALPLPSMPQPVDDAARLRILLHQFGPDDAAGIRKELMGLPLARQVERVQQMLAEQAVY